MKSVQVFDKPLCCSTGVCGPEVDPVLPRFASDLEWLKSQGHRVERFNLAQQPQAFLNHPQVQHAVTIEGLRVLPMVLVDGQMVSRGIYPTRDQLAQWTGGEAAFQPLPIASSGCCGDAGCC